jgi:UDP-glucose 4-epimerase
MPVSRKVACAENGEGFETMKVLITGGAGFIGSHLCALLQDRAKVRVIDNLRGASRRRPRLAGVEMIEASVLDVAALRAAISDVEIVFHLAAMTSSKESMENPSECVQINVLGTLNLLRAATDAGVRKLVFASSAAVYGDNPAVPTLESMIPQPKSPYAVTKLDGEYYCDMFAREGWLKTASLRFFNVFGPGQDPLGPYAAAVPAFIERALSGEDLTVFGDGEQTRDFLSVKDAVSALVFAAENDHVAGVFNCGYGQQTTINEIVGRILVATGSRSRTLYLPTRIGDVRHSCASPKKLYEAGWRPVSGLEEGLREMTEALQPSEAKKP